MDRPFDYSAAFFTSAYTACLHAKSFYQSTTTANQVDPLYVEVPAFLRPPVQPDKLFFN